jgi:hypothetical protein
MVRLFVTFNDSVRLGYTSLPSFQTFIGKDYEEAYLKLIYFIKNTGIDYSSYEIELVFILGKMMV